MSGPPGPVTVDVYVRPAQLAEALDGHVRALEEMAAEGVVDAVDVHSWPARVPVDAHVTDAVDRFRTFRAWADDHDVSIQPPFSVHAVASEFTGERTTYLSTPVCCLSVSVGDALAGIYPHSDGDEHYGVGDAIEALAEEGLPAGGLDWPVDPAGGTDRGATGRPACPECGTACVNVQGLLACGDCQWVDRTRAPARRVVSR